MIYLELFLTFFKIGLFTFGGGYAMLPLIQAEVLAKKWLTETEIINFIAVSESTPGPFAINMSTYVGSETGGILGGICATLGVVLPSFIIILIVAKLYDRFRSSKIVSGCMSGLKPAVIGLIASAVISVGSSVFMPINIYGLVSLGIFIVAAIMSFKRIHPIIVICMSAIVGIILGFVLNIPV